MTTNIGITNFEYHHIDIDPLFKEKAGQRIRSVLVFSYETDLILVDNLYTRCLQHQATEGFQDDFKFSVVVNSCGIKPTSIIETYARKYLKYCYEFHPINGAILHAKFVLIIFSNNHGDDVIYLAIFSRNLTFKREVYNAIWLRSTRHVPEDFLARDFAATIDMVCRNTCLSIHREIITHLGEVGFIDLESTSLVKLITKNIGEELKSRTSSSNEMIIANSVFDPQRILEFVPNSCRRLQIMCRMTSAPNFKDLALTDRTEIGVFREIKDNERNDDFWGRDRLHKKFILTKNRDSTSLFVGSPNITIGGLYRNVELLCWMEGNERSLMQKFNHLEQIWAERFIRLNNSKMYIPELSLSSNFRAFAKSVTRWLSYRGAFSFVPKNGDFDLIILRPSFVKSFHFDVNLNIYSTDNRKVFSTNIKKIDQNIVIPCSKYLGIPLIVCRLTFLGREFFSCIKWHRMGAL